MIFHLVAISLWASPINSPLVIACRNAVRPYFLWTGLFQSWDMFAPNPKSQNSYLEAVIIYKDGSTKLWTFPRMELLSFTGRMFEERYRKYEENLQSGLYADLRPDAARYIARLNSDAAHPAQTVMLVARWSQIMPPGKYPRGPEEGNVFFSYTVKPEDLK